MEIVRDVLRNGLRVLVWPKGDAESASVILMLKAGSRCETRETNGIAHFLEHMFFRGGARYPDEEATTVAIESIGGAQNASTGTDEVAFTLSVPSVHSERAFDVLSDMLLHARFAQEDIELERGAVLQEIASYKDSSGHSATQRFGELLFGDTPLGWDIAGPPDNIRRFGRDDFLTFRERMYNARDAVLVVVGGVEPDVIFSLAERYFLALPQESPGPEGGYAPVVRCAKPVVAAEFKKRDQLSLVLGTAAPERTSKLFPACEILEYVLGGGMASRLFLEVRSRRGLAYSVNAGYGAGPDYGYFACHAGIAPNNLGDAVAAIAAELKKLRETRIAPHELERARQYRNGKLMRALESSSTMASVLAHHELHYGGVWTPAELIHETDYVTAEDVCCLAQELFQPANLRLALVGPWRGRASDLHAMLCS